MSVSERSDYWQKYWRAGKYAQPAAGEAELELDEERRGQIVRLLETRNDHLPGAGRRNAVPSGFVNGAKAPVSCEDCLANGRVMFGCVTCRGRGYVEEHRSRDPYAENKITPYGFDVSRHDATHARDRELAALDHQLAQPKSLADELDEANHHPYAWERDRARMYRLFDYAALDAALETIRERAPSAYSALRHFYVDRPLGDEPVGLARLSCEAGIRFLHQLLPAKLRAPDPDPDRPRVVHANVGTDPREFRDREMRQQAAAGADPATLARTFKVSIRTVYRIVNG